MQSLDLQYDTYNATFVKKHVLYMNGGQRIEDVAYSHGVRQTLFKMYNGEQPPGKLYNFATSTSMVKGASVEISATLHLVAPAEFSRPSNSRGNQSCSEDLNLQLF